jgi:hypothetical protein
MSRILDILTPGYFLQDTDSSRARQGYKIVVEACSWVAIVPGMLPAVDMYFSQGMSARTAIAAGLVPVAYGATRIVGQLLEETVDAGRGAVERWREKHKCPLSEFEAAKLRVDAKRQNGTYVRIDDAIAHRELYDRNEGA